MNEEEQQHVVQDPIPAHSLKEYITEKLGYKEAVIKEYAKYYLVAGDLLFLKSDSSKYLKPASSNQGKIQQARMQNLVNFFNTPNGQTFERKVMTVYIDPSIPGSGDDNWRPEIAAAITEWNSVVRSGVTMQLINDRLLADLIISDDAGLVFDDNIIAVSASPTPDGKPGFLTAINFDYKSNKIVSSLQKKYNIVHELGHTVGLQHTNWQNNPCFGGGPESIPPSIIVTPIPGTPSSDPNSVMNGCTAESTWNGFSLNDVGAIQALYFLPYKNWLHDPVSTLEADPNGKVNITWFNDYPFPDPVPANVRVEIYNTWFDATTRSRKYSFRRTIITSTPNTGVLINGLDYSIDNSSNGFDLAVKMISTMDPSVYDFSEPFNIHFD